MLAFTFQQALLQRPGKRAENLHESYCVVLKWLKPVEAAAWSARRRGLPLPPAVAAVCRARAAPAGGDGGRGGEQGLWGRR